MVHIEFGEYHFGLGSWQVREAAHWYFLVAICQVLIDSFGSFSAGRDRQKSAKSGHGAPTKAQYRYPLYRHFPEE